MMNWPQIIFSCTSEQSERLDEALLELGALSITYQDAADQPLLEPGVGEMPLWDKVQFSALFEVETNVGVVLGSLERAVDFPLPTHRVEIVEQKDWEHAWKKHYHALCFGERLWICPSWQAPPEPDAVNLMLDPGLAFGTGTHQSTSLCLQWLDGQAAGQADGEGLEGKTVLDYGCGSGVLGVAALLLGAKSVRAVDNDPQALVATKDNAQRNGCDDRLMAFLPKPEGAGAGDELVDIVLANILAKPLIDLAPLLSARLKVGGSVVLAGLLKEQAGEVMAAYEPFVVFETPVEFEGWLRLEGKRQNR